MSPIYPVSPSKQTLLEEEMARLGIDEADLEEAFLRGGGPGGQKINKTSVVVSLTHVPSGTTVRCQESRSQAMNRFLARRMLVDAIKEAVEGEKSRAQQAREKIRRQKRKRSKRAKEKMLADKRHTSVKKATRRKKATATDE